MLLFSNDNYFIFGMNSILKDMNNPITLKGLFYLIEAMELSAR